MRCFHHECSFRTIDSVFSVGYAAPLLSMVGHVGGTDSSYRQDDQYRQPELSKIVDMVEKQKQLVDSVIETQKELEKTGVD